MFFFFKQKTAYEMRISDWSSDVCSSDLSDEYYRFIDKVRSRPKVENPTIAEARAALEKIGERMVPPTGVQFDTVDADGVPAEWATPPECDLGRIILYAHGGGYEIGRAHV